MFKFKTRDKRTADTMRFYTTEKVGIKRSVTPEGFLLCEDVPLARIGTLIYGPGETPIRTVGADNLVRIHREADEVFREETINSFAGKPFTDEHPDVDVDPTNWNKLAKGIVLNPRRGLGSESDLMLGDILITDKATIDKVTKDDKVEVSCGYDADYEEIGPGEGRQSNIIGNHVALVNRGRCGPRCAIGDAAPNNPEKQTMSKKTKDAKAKILSALTRAFKAKDSSELEELAEEVHDEVAELTEPSQAIHVHIDSDPKTPGTGNDEEVEPDARTMDDEMISEFMAQNAAEHEAMAARIEALEAKIAELSGGAVTGDDDCDLEVMDDAEALEAIRDEAPDLSEEEAGKARDSAFLKGAYDRTVSAAEILVPGIQIPAFDAKANPKRTVDGLKAFRAKVLTIAGATKDAAPIISELSGGKAIDAKRMKSRDVATMFTAAATLRRAMNNASAHTRDGEQHQNGAKSGIRTIAELNAANRERKW